MESENILTSVDRLTIIISDDGLELTTVTEGGKTCMTLTAVEALMLLDILQAEAVHLRNIADQQSPLPIRFTFNADGMKGK